MGVILDSSVLIAGERRGEGVLQIIQRLQKRFSEMECVLSAVSIVELTHGIYRTKNSAQQEARRVFVEEICRDFSVYPITLEVAQLAGKIEGELASQGLNIAFEDLLIGSTALHLGYGVVTGNIRHFQMIPGLTIIQE